MDRMTTSGRHGRKAQTRALDSIAAPAASRGNAAPGRRSRAMGPGAVHRGPGPRAHRRWPPSRARSPASHTAATASTGPPRADLADDPLIYGLVRVGTADNAGWLVPQAFVFLVAGVWLLALTDSSGRPGRAPGLVAAARHRRPAEDGTATAAPGRDLPLGGVVLLLPVVPAVLVEQPPHAGGGAGNLRYRRRHGGCGGRKRPRSPPCAGTVLLGLVSVLWTCTGSRRRTGQSVTAPFSTARCRCTRSRRDTIAGLLPATQGGPSASLLAGAQGLALAAFGVMLAPRLLALGRPTRSWRTGRGRLTQRVDPADPDPQRRDRAPRSPNCAASSATCTTARRPGWSRSACALRAAEQLMPANPEAALALVAEATETSSRALDRPARPGARHLPAGAGRPRPGRRGPRPGPGHPADRGHGHRPAGGAADCRSRRRSTSRSPRP